MSYNPDQQRDDHGRFAGNGGPSTARAEKVRLAQQLDARNRSKTFGFGPLARAKEMSAQTGKPAHPAHMTGILRALGAKPRLKATAGGLALAQTSALGATHLEETNHE